MNVPTPDPSTPAATDHRRRRPWPRLGAVVVAMALVTLSASCSSSDSRAGEPASSPTTTGSGGSGGSTSAPAPPPPAPGSLPKLPAPNGLRFDAHHLQLRLTRTQAGPRTISFGVPVAGGIVDSVAGVSVTAGGRALPASVRVLLRDHDAAGAAHGVRSILVQLPSSVMTAPTLDVDVAWKGGKPKAAARVPYRDTSFVSRAVARTADRTIEKVGSTVKLVVTHQSTETLFTGAEPAVLVDFPPGYLASTGLLGDQATSALAPDPSLAGMDFISNYADAFAHSAVYDESYPLNPADDSVVVPDPKVNYEGWLYDRCATFLSIYSHTGDVGLLRAGYRNCAYYAGAITLTGANRGMFTGKADLDTKYSHVRGLYIYYALTGDEKAKAAAEAIADLWHRDPDFVVPYVKGHIRAPDHLWTERLLGVSMEGEYFGYLMTDRRTYLTTFKGLLTTAYRHITGNAATLKEINPGTPPFPPQNCFIHTAEQHGEGDADQPWCSGWMTELLLPVLLAYQQQTGDKRVDEIFVRLTRFLRDVGTSYFQGNPIDDTFLHPKVKFDPTDTDDPRELMPLYGSGLGTDGKRLNEGDYDDTQHCLDATALVAAGLRGLRRQGEFDKHPIGPFASEGASFLALENELAFCAEQEFTFQTRTNRDPATWTSDTLAPGLSDPKKFISDEKIGYPTYADSPERRLSWWFNSGLLDFGLLKQAGVQVPKLTPGAVEP